MYIPSDLLIVRKYISTGLTLAHWIIFRIPPPDLTRIHFYVYKTLGIVKCTSILFLYVLSFAGGWAHAFQMVVFQLFTLLARVPHIVGDTVSLSLSFPDWQTDRQIDSHRQTDTFTHTHTHTHTHIYIYIYIYIHSYIFYVNSYFREWH